MQVARKTGHWLPGFEMSQVPEPDHILCAFFIQISVWFIDNLSTFSKLLSNYIQGWTLSSIQDSEGHTVFLISHLSCLFALNKS